MEQKLNQPEQRELLMLARQTIASFLETGATPDYTPTSNALSAICGCFVSLKQKGALRGCIGNFISDRPLYRLVQDMAMASATKDPRFYPLTRSELDAVTIEISVLSPLRPITEIQEIRVGEHGLYIEKGVSRGVLLPQVATEYGWDRETFLRQTCIKAGLKEDAWQDKATISIFSAQVFTER